MNRVAHHSRIRGSKPRWHGCWRVTALLFDATALSLALGGAAVLRYRRLGATELAFPHDPTTTAPWLLAVPIWLASLALFGLYNPNRWANAVEEARRIVAAGLAAPTAVALLAFFAHIEPSRLWVGIGAVLSTCFVGIGRRGLRWTAMELRKRGHWGTRAVVVGGVTAKPLVDALALDHASGVWPVATCGFKWGSLPAFDVENLADAISAERANTVVVDTEDLRRDEVQRSVAVADDLSVNVYVVPGLDYALLHNLQIVPIGREPALSIEVPSLRPYQRVVKRVFDLAASITALVLLSPMFIAIAIAIRLDSPGPIFFRQRRVGWFGSEFEVIKFRTMIDGAHELRALLEGGNDVDAGLFKMRYDPRMTRVGRLLRRWSLDELPQFWNVIRGDMSVVGPRPALPEEVGAYEKHVVRRLAVRPGITGLWQVSGRSDLEFGDYVRLDLTYVQNWGLLLDLYILLRTTPVVLGGRGAY